SPFRANTPEEMLRPHREARPPDPWSLAPDIPEADIVSTTILRALDKNPDQRFASCEAFATALGCKILSTVTATGEATAPPMLILLEGNACAGWEPGNSRRAPHLA